MLLSTAMLHLIRSCFSLVSSNRISLVSHFSFENINAAQSGNRTPPILVSKKPARNGILPTRSSSLPYPQTVGQNVQLSPHHQPSWNGAPRGRLVTGRGELLRLEDGG